MLAIIIYGFLHGSIFRNRIKLFKEIYALVENARRMYRQARFELSFILQNMFQRHLGLVDHGVRCHKTLLQ